jgi:1-acyl-sn-glycerol-3-phosphate acyltransferase
MSALAPTVVGLGRTAFGVGWTGVISGWMIASQLRAEDPERVAQLTRRWARRLARGIGMEVHTYGSWNLDPVGSYVLMANHRSVLDIPALVLAMPHTPGFLAKAELAGIPLFGRAMQVGGHVFVERKGGARALQAMREAAEAIGRGRPIVIFPEGTRSPTRALLPFKKGAFVLAKQARVPIVPVGLRGTETILPKGGRVMQPGRVEVHVGAPIDVSTVRRSKIAAMVQRVREEVGRLADAPAA